MAQAGACHCQCAANSTVGSEEGETTRRPVSLLETVGFFF